LVRERKGVSLLTLGGNFWSKDKAGKGAGLDITRKKGFFPEFKLRVGGYLFHWKKFGGWGVRVSNWRSPIFNLIGKFPG